MKIIDDIHAIEDIIYHTEDREDIRITGMELYPYAQNGVVGYISLERGIIKIAEMLGQEIDRDEFYDEVSIKYNGYLFEELIENYDREVEIRKVI